MAFVLKDFAPHSSMGNSFSPRLFGYRSSDSFATITTASYFSQVENMLNDGDLIFVNNTSDSTQDFLGTYSAATNTLNEYYRKERSSVLVQNASDLAGPLDSTVEYIIDGQIDMGSQSIEVPAGGLHFHGLDFDISALTSSEDNYTMFTSPVGGSGNVLFISIGFSVTGSSSKVFDVVDSNGFHAIEFTGVNFNNCTSLGTIDGYRQVLELDTGRFGGTPNLTLEGTWVGGYRITTSIVRSLDAGMTGALFQKGSSFSMASRFLTDINCDLPASAALFDFESANFVNPSTLQVNGAIISRNGVFDATDSNLTPNITKSDIKAQWGNNVGLDNTFEGGKLTVSSETATTISIAGTFTTLLGTFTASELEHFDSPSNGQLRHIGNSPREYSFISDLVVDGTANDVIRIRIMKYDASAASSASVGEQVRQVNSLVGARDVAFFTLAANFTLDINDYIYLEVTDDTATNNVTVENSSFFQLGRR